MTQACLQIKMSESSELGFGACMLTYTGRSHNNVTKAWSVMKSNEWQRMAHGVHETVDLLKWNAAAVPKKLLDKKVMEY